MLSNGKEKTKTEEERHSAPDQQPLTQLWAGGIYMGLVGTVSLNAPCVQEEAITSGKRREKNPIRRVQDLMGWYQAWRQRTCMHARTHARTHAHPRLTKETQRKVRAPPWFVGPVRGSEASTANICRVTKLGLTAELGHIPVRELSVSGGERGKKGASPRGPKQLPSWAAEGKGADSIP